MEEKFVDFEILRENDENRKVLYRAYKVKDIGPVLDKLNEVLKKDFWNDYLPPKFNNADTDVRITCANIEVVDNVDYVLAAPNNKGVSNVVVIYPEDMTECMQSALTEMLVYQLKGMGIETFALEDVDGEWTFFSIDFDEVIGWINGYNEVEKTA